MMVNVVMSGMDSFLGGRFEYFLFVSARGGAGGGRSIFN